MTTRYIAHENIPHGWEVTDTRAVPQRTFAAGLPKDAARALVDELNGLVVELVAAERLTSSQASEPAQAEARDAARLQFIEDHSNMFLRFHKKKWAFAGLTNYEYEVFNTLREAIDAAMGSDTEGRA